MNLRFFNYLTRKKDEFRPIRPKRVGLYTCGPTAYNDVHIGNLRTFVFDDILRRTLEAAGNHVTHIMNITDVDDKTIAGARESGKKLAAFTQFYEKAFYRDLKKLNILPATKYTRATAHISAMIGMISALLKKKIAYAAPDGVYFSIAKFKPYGKLSQIKKRTLKIGARISADEYEKADANDFVLWKMKRADEPSWKAPFGEGRPGWHIECSAMSVQYLGQPFDIHTGGVDLLFPHHEDEIAQSEAAAGKPFAKFFMEGEHLLVDGKKMSKSLGNFFTLVDIEKRGINPLDFRYFVLGAHYRTQLNFTWEGLSAARSAREGITNALSRIAGGPYGGTLKDENAALSVIAGFERSWHEAVADDLNLPRALAALNEVLHYAHSLLDRKLLTKRAAKLLLTAVFASDRVFGLGLKVRKEKISASVLALVEEREELRKEKKWAEADEARKHILNAGFLVEDTPAGPRIKKR